MAEDEGGWMPTHEHALRYFMYTEGTGCGEGLRRKPPASSLVDSTWAQEGSKKSLHKRLSLEGKRKVGVL